MLTADDAAERARVERLRLETSAAQGAAARAREGLQRARLRTGAADKAARATRAARMAARREGELERRAGVVREVQAGRGRAAGVAAARVEEKRRGAEEVRRQAEEDGQVIRGVAWEQGGGNLACMSANALAWGGRKRVLIGMCCWAEDKRRGAVEKRRGGRRRLGGGRRKMWG